MDYIYYATDYDTLSLTHHGILGMKWGVRRYQDSNGNWTEEGLERRRGGLRQRMALNSLKRTKSKRLPVLYEA